MIGRYVLRFPFPFRVTGLGNERVVPALFLEPTIGEALLGKLGDLPFAESQFLGDVGAGSQAILNQLAEELRGIERFTSNAGLAVVAFAKVPFERRSFRVGAVTILVKGRNELCAALGVGDVLRLGEPDNPVGSVFASGRATHGTIASSVVNEDDGDAMPAQFEKPRLNHLPSIRVVLFDAAEQTRQVIEKDSFDAASET